MTDDEDIDGLAGEYVIGTLNASERASVAARRAREPALNADILDWERRLAPLTETADPVAPPPSLFAKIEARVDGDGVAPAGSATIINLHRRVKIWRAAALAASALAAALVLTVGVREFQPTAKQQNLVAVLQKDAASPAFIVTVDVENRIMTVRPVAAKHEPGKSYELWLVQDSLGAPKSLGVIDGPHAMVRSTLAAYQTEVIKSATFAVSLEPEGGSPTGAPTGPVVFSGKLIPTTN
jgi:anti-sigma-K factor RskA